MANEKVEINGFPYFKKFADGTVVRFLNTELSQANPHDYSEGAKSKDLLIDPSTDVFVRLYLPEMRSCQKLPILFYIHGGGFCVGSAASTLYYKYLNKVANELNLLCVAVNYRKAPEHRFPAAYDDCFTGLRWLLAGGGREDPWIASAADFGRVFLAGDSAGANIVHEVGLRAGAVEWPADVKLAGGVFFHPFFHDIEGGKEAYDKLSAAVVGSHASDLTYEKLLSILLPEGENVDYPPINPVGPRSPPLSRLAYERMLVAVAENDFVKEVGIKYHQQLVNAGCSAELECTAGEGHVFHLMDIACPAALALLRRLSAFIYA